MLFVYGAAIIRWWRSFAPCPAVSRGLAGPCLSLPGRGCGDTWGDTWRLWGLTKTISSPGGFIYLFIYLSVWVWIAICAKKKKKEKNKQEQWRNYLFVCLFICLFTGWVINFVIQTKHFIYSIVNLLWRNHSYTPRNYSRRKNIIQ